MPLLGFNAPVTGSLDADASVHGRFPNESLSATASVQHGTVGRVQSGAPKSQ